MFVYHKASDGGAPVPLVHRSAKRRFALSYPPSAYDWDVVFPISGWQGIAHDVWPQPGLFVARPDLETFQGGELEGERYGHVGILDYDGAWIQGGALTVNKYPHLSDPSYQPAIFRQYVAR